MNAVPTSPDALGDPEFSSALPKGLSAGVPERVAPPVLALGTRSVLQVILGIAAVLLALHLLAVWSYLADWRFPARDKFYFDAENNIPTVFSSAILLFAGLLLCWITAIKRQQADPFRWRWAGLAALFLALAVDESASLHELLIQPLRTAYQLTGWLRFPWVIAGGTFAIVFAVVYLRFLMHLPPATRRWFILAGLMYVGGAVGMEMVGGHVFMEEGTPDRTLVPYMIAMTLEESLEISGAALFVAALLQYLSGMSARLRVVVD
ncbi:hypothetical protein JI739_00210 [Ramlibacter sp. AW1]|uniref:Uncharacterized protein n=1 Tax=Ramlibacter aurantiacus TaxID=2801330 RepID=A0A936ZPS8_9BURK|nr:hypothetical protein [Ramlibacter aurantiacus]MBL0418755.1 hypothetical protein [Ramlibacter aurantiacus]